MIVISPSTFEYWHDFVFFPSLEYFSMFASFFPSYCQINGNNYYPLFILIFNVLTENRNIFNVKLTAGYQNRTRLYYNLSNLSIFFLFFLFKLSQYMPQSTLKSPRRSRETETWWEFFSLLCSSVSNGLHQIKHKCDTIGITFPNTVYFRSYIGTHKVTILLGRTQFSTGKNRRGRRKLKRLE